MEEYDGACGVVVEEEKDGRFFRVETTRKGVTCLGGRWGQLVGKCGWMLMDVEAIGMHKHIWELI